VFCIAICMLKIFALWLGLRFEVLIVLRIHKVVHIYWLHVHTILKRAIWFAICVLKMFTVWLGLRFEMPIVMTIHNVLHHHLLTLCAFNSLTCNLYSMYCNPYAEDISALARLVTPPSLVYGHYCLAGTFCISCYYLHRPTENGVSIFLNIVTQQQSMYKACSLSKVPTSIIF